MAGRFFLLSLHNGMWSSNDGEVWIQHALERVGVIREFTISDQGTAVGIGHGIFTTASLGRFSYDRSDGLKISFLKDLAVVDFLLEASPSLEGPWDSYRLKAIDNTALDLPQYLRASGFYRYRIVPSE